jgi:hypothetical protein
MSSAHPGQAARFVYACAVGAQDMQSEVKTEHKRTLVAAIVLTATFMIPLVVLMLWAWLGTPADGTQADRRCRASAFAGFEQTSEGSETRRRVPADRNPLLPGVEVEVLTSSGSSSATTFVTLREPGGRSVEAAFGTSFEQILTRHPVPEELQGTANAAWRRAVEEAAFGTICSQPDPSLAHLLSPDQRLRWLPGLPEMPQSYALYVEPPAPGEPYWIHYLGMNHRRLTEDAFSDELEVIDRKGKLELLRSGHGAVVVDLERHVFAWVYVFAGGRKLRWPSVTGGKLEEATVVLELDHPVIGEARERLRIDLATGTILPLGG